MTVNDETRPPAPATTSATEPTPPPLDPKDRPKIEPTDALPTGEQEEPGLIDTVKSFFSGEENDEARPPAPATTSPARPTPPPLDAKDRPKIEPTDALPTEEYDQ